MYKLIMLTLLLVSSTACTNPESQFNTEDNDVINTSYVHNSASDITKNINEYVQKNKAVYDVISIKSNNRILIALKIKQMHLLKKKKIETSVQKKVAKTYAPYSIQVSTDKKIFMEIKKLIEKEDKSNLDQEFNDLIKLSKEKT